ncbi:glycosyltransferase [Ectobacillus ponti]|uniref:Glycosyltransferase n=1 Tax=Ectobacillus ponti TaxID=2961894 RepID=A0AA42BND0_9BACI|nr:glycosyltransferase [Ectobacillus ponti]MCP8967855.1 glycosyltransferase [Ectobacillus ponti]
MDEEFEFEKNKVHNLSFNKNDTYSYLNMKKWGEISKFLKVNQIEHVFFYSENPFNIVIKYLSFRTPYSFWWHDPVPHSGVSKLKQMLFYFHSFNLLAGKKHRHTFVASDRLRSMVLQTYKHISDRKMKIVNLPFMEELTQYYNPAVEQSREYDFIFFGRIEEYKGLDILYQALEKLNEEKAEYKCLVVGAGNINKYFPAGYDQSNITIINEYVSNKDLAAYIANAKTAVFPYKDSTATQTIQTALYFGCNVIASDTGSFKEYLKGKEDYFGMIFPPNDAQRLYECMKESMAKGNFDTDKYMPELLEKFDIKSVSQNLYHILMDENR